MKKRLEIVPSRLSIRTITIFMSYNSYKIVASYSVCIWKSILLIEQIFISELEGILNFILDCHKHIIVWYI